MWEGLSHSILWGRSIQLAHSVPVGTNRYNKDLDLPPVSFLWVLFLARYWALSLAWLLVLASILLSQFSRTLLPLVSSPWYLIKFLIPMLDILSPWPAFSNNPVKLAVQNLSLLLIILFPLNNLFPLNILHPLISTLLLVYTFPCCIQNWPNVYSLLQTTLS